MIKRNEYTISFCIYIVFFGFLQTINATTLITKPTQIIKSVALFISRIEQRMQKREMAIVRSNILNIKINLFNYGSNSGRLYTHTDLKLLKNGGGSE